MAFPFQKSYISHKIVARLSMQGQAIKSYSKKPFHTPLFDIIKP